ncbi:1-phosphatidylinositol 4,5-bisphosphate phosphodiesterase 1 [Golovinomyces cichoracearum]|uniref:Phosphoinositide phospholipase C n=1 Tax=Golovinomyces cichoracearum TaxID=62708 RepID=A0A420IHA9_9PEZI|nr:1-phosphatidylinositol 4,5-bisphosphate phosphodiesterase 1 [Golovinomyces cichoracearum]
MQCLLSTIPLQHPTHQRNVFSLSNLIQDRPLSISFALRQKMPASVDSLSDLADIALPSATHFSTTLKAKSKMITQTKLAPLATNTLAGNFHPSYPTPINSIISITSGSAQASPVTSPPGAATPFTNSASVQNSPNDTTTRDVESYLPPIDSSEPILSHKTNYNVISEPVGLSKSPGIMRRLSNRASQLASSRRRPSANSLSRDQSSGPVIMRRRSDSNSTVPDLFKSGNLFSDSDDEFSAEIKEESTTSVEGSREILSRTVSSGSSSSPSSVATVAGPVIPSVLLQGTKMMKVSGKKKKFKLLTFVLENEAAKVTWDKNRPSKSFYIDDIKDIRVGADARNYRQEFGVSVEDESRFFSIVYVIPDKSKGRSQKIMHLIANDDHTFDLWTTTLDAISKHRQEFMASLSSFHEKAVEQYWRTEMNRKFQDKPHSIEGEEIDFVGIERLCRSLHINGSSRYLNSRFSQADITGSGRLNLSEFQEFVKLMKRREDVRSLHRQIASSSNNGITIEVFLRFLKDVQKEDVISDRAHWECIFNKFVRRSKNKDQTSNVNSDIGTPHMSVSALTNFLISTFNVPVHSQPVNYTLSRPLNEYFISSSHNTYLLGRQVAGQSSVEAYISVLNRGCRCVEVDCWNGSDGPVVMHGRTLTSQVSFADVMSTISKYAFVKSPFPLCISLEVHCNPQQQAMMVDIIKKTCGAKLLTAPIDPQCETLPSPSQLKHRILIKVKEHGSVEEAAVNESTWRGKNNFNSSSVRSTQHDGSIGFESLPSTTISSRSSTLQHNKRLAGNDGLENLSSSTSDSEGLTEDVVRAKESSRANKTSNIIKELGELAVYTRSIRFPGYDFPESRSYNHIFSFMESTLDKNSKTQEDRHAILRHNMRHLMRIYPNGWRVASTNFDPLKYWRRGVQMVALNWQTYDLGMQLNDAMFASGTDCSGYVLKPRELREEKYIPCISEETRDGHIKRERKNVAFSIDVISAQQLMRPKTLAQSRSFDPYIEVEVYHADDKGKENKGISNYGVDTTGKDGASGFGLPYKRRTHIITENGFNPIFNRKFNFSLTTKYPDLVFIRWTVKYSSDGYNHNEKGAPLAIFTAKLNSLKQGYRTLPLFDCNGDQFLFSTLFCRIKIEPLTSIYVNDPETVNTNSVGVLKTISRSVFNRTAS